MIIYVWTLLNLGEVDIPLAFQFILEYKISQTTIPPIRILLNMPIYLGGTALNVKKLS